METFWSIDRQGVGFLTYTDLVGSIFWSGHVASMYSPI